MALSESDRETFFGSLKFDDAFVKAAPAGTRIDPKTALGPLMAQSRLPKSASTTTADARPSKTSSGPMATAPIASANDVVAEVSTSAGMAPRVTREFRVSSVATKNDAAGSEKELDRNSQIQTLGWNVPVDRPAELPVYDTSRPLNLTVTANRLPQTPVVVFANSPSPCAIVGVEGQERVVWNLATRQKLGTIPTGRLKHSPVALSADGLWIAAPTLNSATGLTIWSVETGKVHTELLDIKADSGFRFLNATRLLVEGPSLALYDLADGTLAGLTPPTQRNQRWLDIAVGPGGRTFAAVSPNELTIHDCDSGQTLGRMSFGYPLSNGTLAFSPDGSLLALAAQRVGNFRLCEINVADGSFRRDFVSQQLGEAAHEVSSQKTKRLLGFPGNGGWLFGDKLFVRSDLEGVAWTFDTLRSPSHPHQTAITATENSILRLAPDPKGGKLVFETIGSRALEVTKGDVQVAADALLPKLTTADWSQVVEVLPASQPKWNVPQRSSRSGAATNPTLTFELGARFTRGAALVGQQQLAVICQPSGPSTDKAKGAKNTNNDGTVRFELELYNTTPEVKKQNPAPAKPTKQVTIPFPCDLIDVSPSARFALVRAGSMDSRQSDRDRQGQLTGRLDVIDLQSGQHVLGWRPFFDLFARAVVDQAGFVDDQHVLTLSQETFRNQGAVVVLWKLPECRAEYVIQGISTRTLSPDRKVLGIARQVDALRERGAALKDEPRGLFLLDAITGATLGHLPGGTSVTHAAFHPREPRLFALTQHESVDIAIEWNLDTAEILREFALPSEGFSQRSEDRNLTWTAQDQLLVNGRTILDPKREIYSATLRFQDVVFLPQSFESRAWFLGEIDQSKHLIGLGATELPDSKMSGTIQLAMPQPDLILKPGGTLALSFQLAALPADVVAEVQKRVRDRLELMQIKIAESSDTTLVVSAVEEQLGTVGVYVDNPSPFALFGIQRPDQPPPKVMATTVDRRIACRFQLVRGGKVEREFRSWANNFLYSLKLREAESAQAQVDQYMVSGAKRLLLETRLPPYVFGNEWRKGLTSWQLSPKGIEQRQQFR